MSTATVIRAVFSSATPSSQSATTTTVGARLRPKTSSQRCWNWNGSPRSSSRNTSCAMCCRVGVQQKSTATCGRRRFCVDSRNNQHAVTPRTRAEIDDEAKHVSLEALEPARTQQLRALAEESGESFDDFMARNFEWHAIERANLENAHKAVEGLNKSSTDVEYKASLHALSLIREHRDFEGLLRKVAENTGLGYRDTVKRQFKLLLEEQEKR